MIVVPMDIFRFYYYSSAGFGVSWITLMGKEWISYICLDVTLVMGSQAHLLVALEYIS